ncbi:MAG: aminotransferase class I/II-fold pyridoxal phosphate-dependent enzyme [Aquificaceae bacterium]
MRWIEEELGIIDSLGLMRERKVHSGSVFCDNDYLGLSSHPEVLRAIERAIKEFGAGAKASPLVSGYTKPHESLERELSLFKGSEDCVVFGSGYLANIGVIPALVSENDAIFSDSLNHASIIDGCRLSRAKVYVFEHLSVESLREKLLKHRKNARRCLIILESLYSMDADCPDIEEFLKLSEEFDCMILIDEAHATGTIGKTGRGILEERGIDFKENLIMIGTLSKALGAYGAFVCASKRVCSLVVNRSRSYIFSTSLSPIMCEAARASLEVLKSSPQMVQSLQNRARVFRQMLNKAGISAIGKEDVPIVPVILGSEKYAIKVRDELLKRGFFIQAIRYPTVPKGSARLRISVSLKRTPEEEIALINALREVICH